MNDSCEVSLLAEKMFFPKLRIVSAVEKNIKTPKFQFSVNSVLLSHFSTQQKQDLLVNTGTFCLPLVFFVL